MIGTNTGTMKNSGTIKLTGDASIGMYGEKITLINSRDIEVGDGGNIGGELNSSVGIYGKGTNSVINNGNITVGKGAVGIYGEKTKIFNNQNISSTLENVTGIYGQETDVKNIGEIKLKDDSNGIYVKDGNIINEIGGKIEVGTGKSAGIFAAGTTDVQAKGHIKTLAKTVGISGEKGNINVANTATFDLGESSTYVYTERGTIENNADIQLSDYSVGLYTKMGKAENKANLTTGKSKIVDGEDPMISVAMATERGEIINTGTIKTPHKYDVGMVANDGGIARNIGRIEVNGKNGFGMQATKEKTSLKPSELINDGIIVVNGDHARGMAATNGCKVVNNNLIEVNGERAQGIYVDYDSIAINNGTIKLVSADKKRASIFIGNKGILQNKGNIYIGSNKDSNDISILEAGYRCWSVGIFPES